MPHQLLVALFISSFLTNLSTSFITPPAHKHILLRKDIAVNFQDPLASVYQIPNLNVIDRQDFHVLKSIFNSTNGDEWFWRSPAVDRVIVTGNGNGKNQPWDFDLIEQNMNYSIPCYDWSDTIQCNSNGKVIALSLQQFKAMLSVMPDWFILFSKPQGYHRCITVAFYSTGTGGRRTGLESGNPKDSDYLYNFLKCIPEENMDEKMIGLKQKYERIIAENRMFRFFQVSTLFLVLNEEKTHIEKRIAHSHSLDVIEL